MTNDNNKNITVREELAWFIVERMNDAVGFHEAYEEVGEYLNIISERIQKLIDIDEQTIKRNYFNEEMKIQAITSKNVLTLVLEMLR